MNPGLREPVHAQKAIDALEPMLGKPPMATLGPREDPPFLWERAYKDALKALRTIPDPALFAVSIDEQHREALRAAWRGQNGWRVHPQHVRDLRILGLVEVGGECGDVHERNHLTAFGMAVRRVVVGAI